MVYETYTSWLTPDDIVNYPVHKKKRKKQLLGNVQVTGRLNTTGSTTFMENKYKCSYKIPVYFTPTQEELMHEWIHITRWITNRTIKRLRGGIAEKSWRSERSQYNLWVEDNPSHPMVVWSNDCCMNKHVLDQAIKRVYNAKKSANTNHFNKIKTGKYSRPWLMRYIREHKPVQIMAIPGECFGEQTNMFCLKSFQEYEIKKRDTNKSSVPNIIRTSKNINPDLDPTFFIKDKVNNKTKKLIYDSAQSTLQYNFTTKEWFMLCPRTKLSKHVSNKLDACAIDPGVSVFATVYDTKGCTEIHRKDKKLWDLVDKTRIKSDKFHSRKAYKKFIRKRYYKIGNIVDDLHWQTAKYLVSNYDTIILGKLSTSSCVRKAKYNGTKRNLSARDTKRLLTLSHYTFQNRLEYMCNKYNSKFILQDEKFTTKSCGKCGEQYEIGKAKTYNCPSCNWTWGRDFNGARNIMIKYYNSS
jgi:IS605 OrfB family transposase